MDLLPLPFELLQSLENVRGFDKDSFEKLHASGEQVVSVRFNPAKASVLSSEWLCVSGELSDVSKKTIIYDQPLTTHNSPLTTRIPWSSYGYYLSARPSFTLDPFFHAGVYYVQEASGMFLEQALRQTVDLSKPIRVLDLCAAPGGKSTLIQSLIAAESLLVSNEVIKTRVNILEENMIKWGGSNVIITNNDPKDFSRLQNYFDVIVVDAPCSGSGLFRREPQAVNEWSIDHVNLCSQRQQRILADVWPSLKQNGILIYCTCSYSKEENEDIVDWMMDQFTMDSLRLKIDDEWKIIEVITDKHNGYGYRFYPDKVKGEGFFISCLQKKDGSSFSHQLSKKQPWEKLNKSEEQVVRQFISPDHALSFFKHNDMLHALPANCTDDRSYLMQSLYLKKAGVLLGKLISGELIPDHELALSTSISTQIPSIKVNKDDALRYLRKEEIKIDTTVKGWALIQYEQQNLGWVKILQNRINNYYPKTWRIQRM